MGNVGVVTGAGRGMGYSCAERLAVAVDVLVLVDRDEDGLASAATALPTDGAQIVTIALDITDTGGVRDLADKVAALGSLRSVAHAAGISPTMSTWRDIVTVDLVGTAQLMDSLLPQAMVGTAVVCFASMAAHLANPADSTAVDAVLDDPLGEGFLDRLVAATGPEVEDPAIAYAWAKRGVQRLVRRESIRWGKRGARICSVSPGMIDTPQGRQEAEHQPSMALLLERTPLGRIGQPEEVAALVTFLLSDEASFLTGCDVLVDGGVCAAIAGADPTDW